MARPRVRCASEKSLGALDQGSRAFKGKNYKDTLTMLDTWMLDTHTLDECQNGLETLLSGRVEQLF